MRSLLWIGYGDIAARAIPMFVEQGWHVTAISRSHKAGKV